MSAPIIFHVNSGDLPLFLDKSQQFEGLYVAFGCYLVFGRVVDLSAPWSDCCLTFPISILNLIVYYESVFNQQFKYFE